MTRYHWLVLVIVMALCNSVSAQPFTSYTSMIPMAEFDKTVPELETRDFRHNGEAEIRISNKKEQHVIFQAASDGSLLSYVGGITYLMYEFHEDKTYYCRHCTGLSDRNILKRLSYYDANGQLKSMRGNTVFAARIEFEIKDLEKFEEAMNKVDEQEGNYESKDASAENIIEHGFDKEGRLIYSRPISTDDFWSHQNFLGRP
ncbi:MAG: hypothetical protein GQF41_1532 [Candidatus Rifleibacterium amylolyticum]|nr:MAG: hypothetical protein GQF41_1532 [Candidatus Rifleibacterium amylolyticum]